MSPRARLLVSLASTTVVGYFLVGSVLGQVMGDSTYGQLSVFNEVIRIVMDAYVDPVNLDRAMAGARSGLTDALDGDSAYLEADEFKAYQQGAHDDAEAGLQLTRRYSFLAVASVRPGSPAEKAGVKAGDILKTIDGKHTRPIPAPVGERMLRGAPGSTVKLTLLRANSDPVEVAIVRARVTPVPASSRALEGGAVAYVKVPEITPQSAAETKVAVEALKRAGAGELVLDLRGTGYGAAADAAHVAELFLDGGVVARLSGNKVPEQVLSADAAKNAWHGPMAVLVDLGTSGAGEVLAAALSEAGRASLVGEHTIGRAGVQKPVPLYDGGLALTVATYKTAKGTVLHGKGLDPTVAVDGDAAREALPEGAPAGDPILDRALQTLKAPPVKKAA